MKVNQPIDSTPLTFPLIPLPSTQTKVPVYILPPLLSFSNRLKVPRNFTSFIRKEWFMNCKKCFFILQIVLPLCRYHPSLRPWFWDMFSSPQFRNLENMLLSTLSNAILFMPRLAAFSSNSNLFENLSELSDFNVLTYVSLIIPVLFNLLIFED